ncbi:MAG: hypothetical protein ABF296_09405 [Oceanococcaceae bacterium]
MTIRIYKSTDAGAPQLDRSLGSLINVLDACLVNGFGAGPTATPLGWSKAFSATNQAAYQMAGGSQRFLLVHDDISNGDVAKVWGYESMSAIDTGVDKWPVFAPSLDGLFWYKNEDAGYNADWQIIGDEAGFYFIRFLTDGPENRSHNHWMNYFGDGIALNSGDDWMTHVGGHYLDSFTGDTNAEFSSFRELASSSQTNPIWAIRDFTGTATNTPMGRESFAINSGTVSSSTSSTAATSAPAARPIAVPAYMTQPEGVRGRYPGLLLPLVAEYNCTHGDTVSFEGVDYFKARLQGESSSDIRCTFYIQITGDWRA